MISPWISWSFHDLLSSRRWIRMTAQQQAAYINLLGAQATDGPLPTNLDELAFLACRNTRDLHEADFTKLWTSPLSDCFELHEGGLVNPRLAKELEVAGERSHRGREAARARWDAKANAGASAPAKPRRMPSVDAPALPEECESECHTDRQTGNSPLTPQGGDPSSLLGAEELLELVASSYPGGKLATASPEGRLAWVKPLGGLAGSVPRAVWERAIDRQREASKQPSRWPTSSALAQSALAVIEAAGMEVPPLSHVLEDMTPEIEKLLVSLGMDPRSRDFSPFGRNQEAWKRAQAIARIVREAKQ